ncbi:MAG: glucose-6-phosphate isomerase, partial [Clostridia bacterium]|nr:glucose-6-phosphate isomerase [Clostridia bacterium]
MALKLNVNYLDGFIREDEYAHIQPMVNAAHELVKNKSGAGNDFLGWTTLPFDYDKKEFAEIKKSAAKIQKSCDVLVVIGIGGSYLGARAVIEFIRSNYYNNLKKDTPDVYFAGCNISADSLNELLAICEGRDVCINVISKSGTTTEPAVAFRVFRELLEKKYGAEGARERIFVTTDKARGTLKAFADEKGYQTFVVPDDIGGRFSVLTAVGLLPIAVAGIDIDGLMKGAQDAALAYADPDLEKNDCYKYAAIRNILYRKGRTTEILVGYEPSAQMLSEWWKQLYGESEGKD